MTKGSWVLSKQPPILFRLEPLIGSLLVLSEIRVVSKSAIAELPGLINAHSIRDQQHDINFVGCRFRSERPPGDGLRARSQRDRPHRHEADGAR